MNEVLELRRQQPSPTISLVPARTIRPFEKARGRTREKLPTRVSREHWPRSLVSILHFHRPLRCSARSASPFLVLDDLPVKTRRRKGAQGGRASLPRRGPQTRTGQTPPLANHMLNWLFNYYVTALRWGSAPPLVSAVSSFGAPSSEAKRARPWISNFKQEIKSNQIRASGRAYLCALLRGGRASILRGGGQTRTPHLPGGGADPQRSAVT